MKRFVVVVVLILCLALFIKHNTGINIENADIQVNSKQTNVVQAESEEKNKVLDDWKITLVNYENALPEDFEVELSDIGNGRKFDSRAIDELKEMLNAVKQSGTSNIWPQSTYRSVARQEEIFNKKVNSYIALGKSKEEAEKLTLKKINKPGTSEHNLGLAVDFNNVDYKFEQTKEYKWLTENAENYGFVLRYPRDKKDITKVDCEPWHWRYVGASHAKKMNELDMCLEEYVEYLKEF